MPFQHQEIIRIAECFITDFGKEAETEIKQRIVDCMKVGCVVTAGIWKKVGAAMAQIRANEDFE